MRSSRPGVDVLVVDTAHGHSKGVLDAVARHQEALTPTSRWWAATWPPPTAPKALVDMPGSTR